MTQPDSDSRQALIERLGYLTTLPREAWGIADDADIVSITVGELRTVVLALRQADEEIERVKKGRAAAQEDNARLGERLFDLTTTQLKAAEERAEAAEASLSSATQLNQIQEHLRDGLQTTLNGVRRELASATLRNEKLREAQRIVAAQAEDEDLWFQPKYLTEDMLQRALRALHAAIEGVSPEDAARAALQLSPDSTPQETKA